MDSAANQVGVLLTVILIAMIFGIFFILTLQNTLHAIQPANRTMKPGKPWLLMIPFFNYVYLFIVVAAIAESLEKQYEEYGIYESKKPTYKVGLALSVCTAGSLIPWLNVLLSIPVFVLWILYWVKVNACRKELVMLNNTAVILKEQASI